MLNSVLCASKGKYNFCDINKNIMYDWGEKYENVEYRTDRLFKGNVRYKARL